MVLALVDRDYPVVSGVNLFFGTTVLAINLIIDLIYPVLRPQGPIQLNMKVPNDTTDIQSSVIAPKRRSRLADFFIRLVKEKPLGTISGIVILMLTLYRNLCRCSGPLSI